MLNYTDKPVASLFEGYTEAYNEKKCMLHWVALKTVWNTAQGDIFKHISDLVFVLSIKLQILQ